MTAREEFEAWAIHEPEVVSLMLRLDGDRELAKSALFLAWQASRTAALEEAAKECDLMQAMWERAADGAEFGDRIRDWDKSDAAEQCAMGIRALNGE